MSRNGPTSRPALDPMPEHSRFEPPRSEPPSAAQRARAESRGTGITLRPDGTVGPAAGAPATGSRRSLFLPHEDMKTRLVKLGLGAMHATRAHTVLAPWSRGVGVIFTLHRVTPEPAAPFSPNRILQVTPDFLDAALSEIRRAGLDLVSMDEAVARLRSGSRRRFVCMTLDDGYHDNLEHAAPVFARHACPYTVYVPSDFADQRGELWWVQLERLIAGRDSVTLDLDGRRFAMPTETVAQKWIAWRSLYWRLRDMDEDAARGALRTACTAAGLDPLAPCHDLLMDWDAVTRLAAEPLATIGAHTVSHRALAKLGAERARAEIDDGVRALQERLGARPRHFSYPYGTACSMGPREVSMTAELGLTSAVTTQPGMIEPGHAAALHALPRVSLNGDYQDMRFLEVFLSGAPFKLYNALSV